MSRAALTVPPARHDIVLAREFDAPRALVFRTYTDPEAIPAWWGPRRLTTTVDRMDVRPGGAWRIVQRDAEGNEYAFHGVYHEVVPPERLVATFEFEGTQGHVVLETTVFEDLGGRTRLTTTSVFQTVEDRDAMVGSGMEEGATESMDRLEELLSRGGTKASRPPSRGALGQLDVLLGEWEFESPQWPGSRGHATFRRGGGGAGVVWESRPPEPAPASTWVIGGDESSGFCTALYHDSRDVSRVYRMSVADGVWTVWREAPGFHQRFRATVDEGARTIRGGWESSQDGSSWEHDFDLVYRRVD